MDAGDLDHSRKSKSLHPEDLHPGYMIAPGWHASNLGRVYSAVCIIHPCAAHLVTRFTST